MRWHRTLMIAICGLLALAPTPILGQSDRDTCGDLVDLALARTDEMCGSLGRNTACYGNTQVEVTLTSDLVTRFAEPGDTIPLDTLAMLRTAAMSEEADTWGVAVLSVQANLPDTLPGQNVTFVVFGDVEIATDDATDEYSAPMQAFRLSTGIGGVRCEAAPNDGILVQAPTDTTVQFSINGVEVNVGSTAFIRQTAADELDISTLDGMVEVAVGGNSVIIEPGNWSRIRPDEPPNEPEPYDNAWVENLPVTLLPEQISIPINVLPSSNWVDTGITLTAGQPVSVVATGEASIWPGCDAYCNVDYCGELCPAVLAGPDGSVPIGEIVPASVPYMTLSDAPMVALLGRIGADGEPFFIGSENTFTAETDGDLFLIVNEDERARGDETGNFTVKITVDIESTE